MCRESSARCRSPTCVRELVLNWLKGIYTATGLLLIPDGQKLTPAYIDKLHNHNRINPISQSLLVYCYRR